MKATTKKNPTTKTPANGKTPTHGLRGRIQDAATKTGLHADRIGTIRLQLNTLRQLGVCVDIDVSGMSMGVTSATLAEFGIADTDERTKRLRSGTKIVFFEEYHRGLRSCESSYRQLLNRYSYEVSGIAPHRWVSFEAWGKWREEASAIEDRFKAIVEKIIRDYDKQRAAYEADERDMAMRAWTAIKAQEYDNVVIDGVKYTRPAEFVKVVVERAMKKFPSREKIATIRMDYHTAVVADVADIEADQLAAEKLQTQKAKEHAKQQNVHYKHLEAMAKLEAVKEAEREHRLKRLSEMRLPLDELANDLRARVKEVVTSMLESVKKNGSVRGKVAEQVQNLKAIYETMSITKDADLETSLNKLAGLVGPVGKERTKETPDRDVEAIRASMIELIDLTVDEIKSVSMSDRVAALEF